MNNQKFIEINKIVPEIILPERLRIKDVGDGYGDR